jgi:hypothetical protein
MEKKKCIQSVIQIFKLFMRGKFKGILNIATTQSMKDEFFFYCGKMNFVDG